MKRDDFTIPLGLAPIEPVRLSADELFANWGFADGELLAEHPAFLQALSASQAEADARTVLADLIEQHLLPALPAPLRTYRLAFTMHNPVRAEDDELPRKGEFAGFEVKVTAEQIATALRKHARPARPQHMARRARHVHRPNGDQSKPLDFPGELIIDNFAGGGGTSTGLEKAFGRPVDIAINHDPEALAMHAINHPHTLHLCESVWDVDPIAVTRNQPVGLVWLSPDCKHFSKAKGGTPVSKDIRGLAWVAVRWTLLTKPRSFMLENVEEFQTWGPLIETDGKLYPDKTRAGQTFKAFCGMLSKGVRPDHPALDEACEFLGIDRHGPLAAQLVQGLGYDIDHRELRARDHNTPTIRKRLFFVGRRDGLPIVWPTATHAEPGDRRVLAGKLAPYLTAAECIDFGQPAASIFGRKKPLATNTQRRVAKGLFRHVLASASPFIVGVGGRMGQSPERSVHQPVQTITSKADSCVAQPVLTPYMVNTRNGERAGQQPRVRSAEEPYWTVTSQGSQGAVAAPVLAPFVTEHANASTQRTMAADEPLRTICAQVKGGHFSVVAPVIAPLRGTSDTHLQGDDARDPLSTISAGGTHHVLAGATLAPMVMTNTTGHPGAPADAPLSTVTTGSQQAVAAMHITKFNTGSVGSGMDEPLRTVTAGGTPKRPSTGIQMGMVAAHLVDMGHGEGKDGTKRFSHGIRSLEMPLNTITASGGTSALSAAHLMHLTHHGERAGSTPASPLPTVTGAHRGEQAIVAACLEQANGGFYDGDGRPADAPTSTITSSGAQQRLVMAYLVKYYSSGGQDAPANGPMHTLPTKGRMGLVEVAQVPAASLAEEHRERARQCADLLHQHLPEQFTEPADMVLMQHAGHWWVLVDITLRMLKPRELFNAQGFPADYVIHEIPDPALLFQDGKQAADPLKLPRIPLSTTAQVRMCGNSVCPPVAEALVRANFAHEAAWMQAA
ncbi:DNA (cytosine-5)-methyltransferase 1 [Paracidovorax wautersii]|uniref:DNA (cytosine-5-)-methyltransferase n=2 Tax=Paracidovorax wautersii TaxID=1177982 RepID=A0A1I2E5Z6_9BURK|nr:DNA cytosine methyltransferase [Paracidovorax wautersii]SFE88056.1 DNA (cytosine-5)-methyltransferase 1 [Paracidovorax wautersii]